MADQYKGIIFSKEEILQKIMELSEPGSRVMFYLSGSPASGGPLGRGAGIIELNPNTSPKSKKYIIYTASVNGMEPGKASKLFESNSPEEIAIWVKDRNKTAEELKPRGQAQR